MGQALTVNVVVTRWNHLSLGLWYYLRNLARKGTQDLLRLLLATNNPGKMDEMRSLLAGIERLELVAPRELGIELSVPETGRTYAKNAALKARAYVQASGLPTLADDSGLEVAALNGAPGLFSARYAPQPDATDADRRNHLLDQMAGKARPWVARFRSTVCLALPNGAQHLFEGRCQGEIIPEERGSQGFGYDAIFQVAGQGRTMAELSMAEKNQLSHRARAMAELIPELELLLDFDA